MKITVTDGYGPRARPRHGFHDYICRIVFSPGEDGSVASDDLQRQVVDFFHRRHRAANFMWCWPPAKLPRPEGLSLYVGDHVWEWGYGYDSGD